MYSIPQYVENSGFSGLLDADVLIKNDRRQSKCRKRGYEVANMNLNGQCESARQNLLGSTRNDAELDIPRARQVGNKRFRHCQLEQTSQLMAETRSELHNLLQPSISTPERVLLHQTTNDSTAFQTPTAYSWQHNHFNRIHQQIAYPNICTLYTNQNIPQHDPWILYNYLMAASFQAATTNEVSRQISNNEFYPTRMSPMVHSNMILEMNRRNHLQRHQHDFIDQTRVNVVSQPSRNELDELRSQTMRLNHAINHMQLIDNSSRNPRDRISNENSLLQEMYSNDSRISNFCNHTLSNSFRHSSICHFHCPNHFVHQPEQLVGSLFSSDSIQRNIFNSQTNSNLLLNRSTNNLEALWPQIVPIMRPVNYPLNISNITALLHLAAPFDQRKRGISKEELDQLPTHRFRTPTSDKKDIKSSPENVIETFSQCLICLEDFESKQTIRVLRCNHEFHSKCIDKWLKINRTCPLCRADAYDGSPQKDVGV